MIILRDNIVAERIRYTRKEKHMTQKELATAVNVSPQVISNWERGYTPEIGDTDLLNLSLALNVSTDYLLGRDIQPAPIKIELTSPQLSPDELALIEKYRKMRDDQKDTMHKVANHISPDEQAAAAGK